MYQQHKLNFFEQIAYAVGRPMQYYRLTKVSSGRFTGFVFLFILIITLISSIHTSYNIFGPNGFIKYLHEDLPKFDLTDGSLYVSDRVEETEANTYILIDTDIDTFSSSDVDKSYGQVILISRSNMVIYQYGRIQETSFGDLGGIHIDNSIIDALLPFVYLIMIFAAIIIYIGSVGWYFFTALLFSLIGLIVNAACHANLTYATIFKTAIYSKVTMVILYALVNLTPLAIPGLARTGLSIIVTSIYVIFGIMSHTSKEAYEEAGIDILQDNNYQ